MENKLVYCIRHGESVSNAQDRFQGPDSPLSELGIKQATFLAKRFKRIPIDIIVSSDYTRALETAKVIQKRIEAPLVVSELLRDRRRPSSMLGRQRSDPETETIEKEIMPISMMRFGVTPTRKTFLT